MKNQTSNLKELTAIYLALRHFLPLIKKSRYKSILIGTDNTAAMYNINKKSGAMNLYRMSRKIWKLSEINCLQLKAAHIPGRINVATDRLSKGNERRLSPERTYDSVKMEIFSESRPVHIKTKQASKNLCISNSEKGSRQYR
jgi:hypothetical protein